MTDLRESAIAAYRQRVAKRTSQEDRLRESRVTKLLNDASFLVANRLARHIDGDRVTVVCDGNGQPLRASFLVDGIPLAVIPARGAEGLNLYLRVPCRNVTCNSLALGSPIYSLADLGRLLDEPVESQLLCDHCIEAEAAEAEEVSAL